MNILTPTGYKSIPDCTVGDQVNAFTANKLCELNSIESIQNITCSDLGYSDTVTVDENGHSVIEPGTGWHWYSINCDNGKSYTLFKDQSIWFRDANGDCSVTHASLLTADDVIFSDDFRELRVTSVLLLSECERPVVWYRLRISGDNTFIADGLMLHNATRYWHQSVGTGGTWTTAAGGYWSALGYSATVNTLALWAIYGGTTGVSIPTAADDAVFDQLSFNSVGACTVSGAVTCFNWTVKAPAQGYMSFGITTANISGSVNISDPNCVITQSGVTTFKATTSVTITNAGASPWGTTVIFNGIGGTFTLGSNLAANSSAVAAITLTNGTLIDAGFSVTAGGGISITGANVRGVVKTGSWSVGSSPNAVSSGTYWNATTTTNLSWSDTAGSITYHACGTTNTFVGGGLEYNGLTIIGSYVTWAMTGINAYGNFDARGASGSTLSFPNAGTQYFKSFAATGCIVKSAATTATAFIFNGTGVPCLSGTTQLTTNCTFQYINASPAGLWFIGATSSDGGHNTGLIFANSPVVFSIGTTETNSAADINEFLYAVAGVTVIESGSAADTAPYVMTTQASQSEVATAPYIPSVIGDLNATAGMTLTLNTPPILQGPGAAKTKLMQSADCVVSIASELRQNNTSITLFARASADMSSMYYVKLSNTVACWCCCCGGTVSYYTTVVTLYKVALGVSYNLGSVVVQPRTVYELPLTKQLSIKAVGSRVSVAFSGDNLTGYPMGYATYLTYLDPNPLPAGFSGAAQNAPAGSGSLTGLTFTDMPGDSIALGFVTASLDSVPASDTLNPSASCAEQEVSQVQDAISYQFVAQVQDSEFAQIVDYPQSTPVVYAALQDILSTNTAFWS
jgi:hypothetical protein